MSGRARAVRVLGAVLSIAAGAWFLVTLSGTDAWDDAAWRAPSTWVLLGALATVYAATGTLLAAAWLSLLGRPEDGRGPSTSTLLARYCHTQVYKYLPTNTLHLVGRHVAYRRGGYRDTALLRAAFVEQLLLVLAATTLVLLTLPYDLRSGGGTFGLSLLVSLASHRGWLSGGLLAVLVVAVVLIARAAPPVRPWHASRSGVVTRLRPIIVALACHVGFFAIAAALLHVLADARPGTDTAVGYGELAAAYALGWLLGSLTPGSPAGVGIREAVLLAVLGNTLTSGEAAVLALQLRIVTTLGDVLLALASGPIALSEPTRSARSQHDEP